MERHPPYFNPYTELLAPSGLDGGGIGSDEIMQEPIIKFQLGPEQGQTIELSLDEYDLIGLAALGHTAEEVADLLPRTYASADKVKEKRDGIIEKFGVPNMTAVVNQAILKGILLIEVDPNPPKLDIKAYELLILALLANGKSDIDIKNNLRLATRTEARNLKKQMFDKLRRTPDEPRTGRTHCLVRAYELGVLPMKEDPVRPLNQVLSRQVRDRARPN